MLNRGALFERIDRMIEESGDSPLGVLVLRATRYREFAILFGYPVAERLEEAMHEMIVRTLRPSDVVYRIGEGAFVLMLPRLHGGNHAVLAATRLVSAFENPIELDSGAVSVAISIGIAIFPEHGENADSLCRHAEAAYSDALHQAERFAMYQPGAGLHALSESDLRSAIENNRLDVHLQPIRSLGSGKIVGAESLARWNELDNVIAPKLFVPFAEQTGLIDRLTHWSLNTTLRYAAIARRAGLDIFFAINLSPHVLRRTDFVEQVLGALAIWEVPGESIVLELTETAIMEDPAQSARTMSRLRDHGVRIAIDDFGTGYSSFSYLRELPASELKIDISFTAGLRTDARVAQLVRSMIDLAHHLDMKVVAEGVEDKATLEALREMGCDMAQGYHIGLPEIADALIARLARRVELGA